MQLSNKFNLQAQLPIRAKLDFFTLVNILRLVAVTSFFDQRPDPQMKVHVSKKREYVCLFQS
jgi:hypothetical protein